MEVLKRIINLIYALLMIFFTLLALDGIDPQKIPVLLKWYFGISAVFAVINFAVFKKFTVWNQ